MREPSAQPVPDRDVAKVLTMRALVPAFLERADDEILAAGPRVVGFSSTFSQNVPSLALARLLKQHDPSPGSSSGTSCPGCGRPATT